MKREFVTKPIDFTGCDPVIADNLKKGLAVKCYVRGGSDYIIWYNEHHSLFPYVGLRDTYGEINPILKPQTETRIKKASEIMKWLEGNGYVLDEDYDWVKDVQKDISFTRQMFRCCGNKYTECEYDFHPEWLEEVSIEQD